MFAGIQFPWFTPPELVSATLPLPVRASAQEEADVVVNLATPVDLSRAFLRLVTVPGNQRALNSQAWIEAVLSANAVTFKYRQITGYDVGSVVMKARVFQLLTRPKSMQTVTAQGSTSLGQAVNAAKRLLIPQCAYLGNAMPSGYQNNYITGGTAVYIEQGYHPRALVLEWY